VLLMCFHYDPMTGKYGLAIAAALRLAGALTMLMLGGFLIVMYRQERRRSRAVKVGDDNAACLAGASGRCESTDDPTERR
ncbi:MAG TPA: hypothetical protein VJ783_27990, partial [Pirellulales bacterium]|nr:hypothetical protein [Pirellulales bacterium]